MKTPDRAYARNERDEKRLIAAGVPAKRIYREDRGAEQWGNWTMRKGEFLGVVNGLLAFGTNRRAMMAALEKCQKFLVLAENCQADGELSRSATAGFATHRSSPASPLR